MDPIFFLFREEKVAFEVVKKIIGWQAILNFLRGM
jgi:hypothetical protein